MKILAFDSTAKVASVAVCENDKLLAQYNIDNGLTQSELLLPMADAALKSLRLSYDDIDLFAATVGPGSFTGVRIGTAVVKGLAFGKNKPCSGVSTLESLAENLRGLEGVFVPVMDARRSQVYNAIFTSDGKSITRLTEDRAISLNDLAEELKEYKDKPIYLCGDGYKVSYSALSDAGVNLCDTPTLLISQNAYSVAKIAYEQYKKDECTTDVLLSPTYLRLPQAERERIEKGGSN
jgi:tRNA threonylcarbamoyladenosine biosynthesis protein TsaB